MYKPDPRPGTWRRRYSRRWAGAARGVEWTQRRRQCHNQPRIRVLHTRMRDSGQTLSRICRQIPWIVDIFYFIYLHDYGRLFYIIQEPLVERNAFLHLWCCVCNKFDYNHLSSRTVGRRGSESVLAACLALVSPCLPLASSSVVSLLSDW